MICIVILEGNSRVVDLWFLDTVVLRCLWIFVVRWEEQGEDEFGVVGLLTGLEERQ